MEPRREAPIFPINMNTLRNIIILGLLCAVGFFTYYEHTRPLSEPNIDPELEIYADQWKADLKSRGIQLPREWKDIESIKLVDQVSSGHTKLGHFNRLEKTIQIKRGLDPVITKTVLYHELGHYVFRLHHHSDGEIMSYNIIASDPAYYGVNWSGLLDTYLSDCE
jgi:hypothetical protein